MNIPHLILSILYAILSYLYFIMGEHSCTYYKICFLYALVGITYGYISYSDGKDKEKEEKEEKE
jgi:hypothetical protein